MRRYLTAFGWFWTIFFCKRHSAMSFYTHALCPQHEGTFINITLEYTYVSSPNQTIVPKVHISFFNGPKNSLFLPTFSPTPPKRYLHASTSQTHMQAKTVNTTRIWVSSQPVHDLVRHALLSPVLWVPAQHTCYHHSREEDISISEGLEHWLPCVNVNGLQIPSMSHQIS